MLKWVLLGIFGLIVAFTGSLSYRLGAFKDVSIQLGDHDEIFLLGVDHLGPYHKIVESLTLVEAWATAHKMSCSQTFGQFLDDPEVIEEARLRAFVGCLITKTDLDRITETSDLKLDASAKGLNPKTIVAGHYVIASFSGSPSIGPFKVYPKVKALIQQSRRQPLSWSMEIYQIQGPDAMTTTYLFPLQ